MNAQKDYFRSIGELPGTIPVFPLPGVLLLPRGELPLNIFEPRYVAMVEDALQRPDRLIGMIQPRAQGDGELFSTGCAGRITSFEELDDGRYMIVLTGVSRFDVLRETEPKRGYRNMAVDWARYAHDLQAQTCLNLDRSHLKAMMKSYFDQQGLSCSWDAVDEASDDKLITALAMICPFAAKEKQALLEAPCCHTRATMFLTMLEMAIREGSCGCGGCH